MLKTTLTPMDRRSGGQRPQHTYVYTLAGCHACDQQIHRQSNQWMVLQYQPCHHISTCAPVVWHAIVGMACVKNWTHPLDCLAMLCSMCVKARCDGTSYRYEVPSCALCRCTTLQSNMTSTAVSSAVMSKLQRRRWCPCKRQDPGWLAGSTCSAAPTPNWELHVHRSQHVLACTLPQPAPNQTLFEGHTPPPPPPPQQICPAVSQLLLRQCTASEHCNMIYLTLHHNSGNLPQLLFNPTWVEAPC